MNKKFLLSLFLCVLLVCSLSPIIPKAYADGTFGYEVKGGSTTTTYSICLKTLYALSEAGTVTVISVYVKNNNVAAQNIDVAIYTGTTRLYRETFSVDGSYDNWKDCTLTTPQELDAATYGLALKSMSAGNDIIFYYDAGSASQTQYDDGLAAADTCQDPFVTAGNVDRKYSIHADYTTGGGPTAYTVDCSQTFTIGLTKAEQTTFNVILSQSITANLVFTALTSYNIILSQGTTIGLSQYAALVYYVTLSLSANLAMIQYFQTAFHVILTHGINPTLTPFIQSVFHVVLQSTWTTSLLSYAINATAVFNHFIVDLALNIATALLNPIEIATTIASVFALAGLALIIALSAFGAIFLVRRRQN